MRAITVLLMLLLASKCFAQDYYVLQVKGNVKRTKTGVAIKPKDVLKADDAITFASATDAIAVVNAKTGRFVLKPGKATTKNEFLSIVKDALTQGTARLSTRSGGFNNIIDFKKYFEDKIYLMPELRFKVNGTAYPINEQSFFYIQYKYNGEDIPKQLQANRDSMLIINRGELFKIDGKAINPESASSFQLYYYTNNSALLITNLNVDITEPSTVSSEIQTLISVLKDLPQKDLIQQVSDYLGENYGKSDSENIKRWLFNK